MDKSPENQHCPVCGFYCLGKGGAACIDKPALVARAALAEPVADEPVAWLYVEDPWGANEHHFMTDSPESQNCDPRDWTPLYTRPAAAPVLKDCGEPAPGYCKHCKKYTIAEPLAAERGEYPPLPEPAQGEQSEGYMSGCPDLIPATPDFYTADQMRAYVDADRAQRVPLTDERLRDAFMTTNTRTVDQNFSAFRDGVRFAERAHKIGDKP